MSKAFLSIEHVGVSFTRGANTAEVLRDINLQVDEGEFVSIIGHSGCGKSTLLNVVAGLVPVTTGAVIRSGRWCSRTTPCCRGCRSTRTSPWR
jgi:nitrate/nitrite transport system ATP-binding protein